MQSQFNSKEWPTIAVIDPQGKLIAKDLKAADVEGVLKKELK